MKLRRNTNFQVFATNAIEGKIVILLDVSCKLQIDFQQWQGQLNK